MAIHTPDVFHNTIGVASCICATADTIGVGAEQNVPIELVGTTSDALTPKNIKTSTTQIKLTSSWLGYYFVQFNATASGGTDKIWELLPYKSDVALGYGNVKFYQQNISGTRTPYYEISSNFIVKMQKDDDITFWVQMISAENETDLIFYNLNASIYQLEQVGVH